MIIFCKSLGCSRNQIDTEIILGKLVAAGHSITSNALNAHTIIVNTCGFITDSCDEAIDAILEMAEYKKKGKCKKLIVTGCLTQRYKDDKNLFSSLPEVDAFLGTRGHEKIVNIVENKTNEKHIFFGDPEKRKFEKLPRQLILKHYSYIKISEGCNRKCTYCIIPKLRGTQRSKPMESICEEALFLANKNIKEIILTAENTSDYGKDIANKIDKRTNVNLNDVLLCLSENLKTKQIWLRFLYAHPQSLTKTTIKLVKKHKNICAYYDVPVQHASSSLLKKMNRAYDTKFLYTFFKAIRKIDPYACLRTTIIVGFPGETEQDFKILLKFIKDIKFDHLGVFIYSDSNDLKSHHFKPHIPYKTAKTRHDIIMQAQAKISKAINKNYIGKIFKVLVEEKIDSGIYIGRTFFQAPDVDGITIIYNEKLKTGEFVEVKITKAFEYDIAGKIA